MPKFKEFCHRLKIIWWKFLVFFGLKVWVKLQYNRPKFSNCAFHGLKMKRRGKTTFGALYYCPKCHRDYHLQSKGNKLVPV